MQIVIGNLPPETSAEDVRSLLTDEIGLNDFGSITITDSNSESVLALVQLLTDSAAAADVLTAKITDFHWKGRNLTSSHTHMFKEG
ncbi:hypothetical protein WAE56_11480 [Iodobacter sp. LRB]|uniref:hypothetical protein n=1 Tax=unclassified Iodobacter TaxID=235634 RepID=UPI000C0D06A3|nr:hypothetical protein [Iodobacter sp. BJB302]PHV01781.1 hypothetical protein CSQ88_10110 [Iodobacter sp. BJB302]